MGVDGGCMSARGGGDAAARRFDEVERFYSEEEVSCSEYEDEDEDELVDPYGRRRASYDDDEEMDLVEAGYGDGRPGSSSPRAASDASDALSDAGAGRLDSARFGNGWIDNGRHHHAAPGSGMPAMPAMPAMPTMPARLPLPERLPPPPHVPPPLPPIFPLRLPPAPPAGRAPSLPAGLSPRSLYLPLPPLGDANAAFTVEIEVPECLTDRSERGARTGASGATHQASARASARQCTARAPYSPRAPGFVTAASTAGPTQVSIGPSGIHHYADQGTALTPYGWCTPFGLAALAEVVRLLLPGGSSLERNAELQATFGTLRLVQALFFSAPLLYVQGWMILMIEVPHVVAHHITLLASSVLAFASLVIALTAFVTSPAVGRASRVRGWLLSSRTVYLGCGLYFAADVTLRALAVATLSFAVGRYALIFFAMLIVGWVLSSCGKPLHAWLDTALRYFASAMAPAVLDGPGADPAGLLLEALLSTAVCAVCVLGGLQSNVPHPQHDALVAHATIAALAASVALKLAALLWCVFPAMTGRYPVFGVSRCECLSWGKEAMTNAERTSEGTRKFMERRVAGGAPSDLSGREQY